MLIILYILTGLAFAAVVLTLVMGAVTMTKQKSDENSKKSNLWMRRRIYAQAAAIGFLALTVYMKTKGA